ncbi:phage tail length tape measure family protein [Niveispirillum cyanobacteriorum]|uniref:Uncharacterized protein n=1 Tax=Niveispirillum cyanobacteriorum TaxID=1612173 RepID=A0A2K9NG62_9PROT|nr:phage tail length tape measure family protein [Niveispirillum cyanobacteriorum]AUN31235.1 hypothetical protein C0V82_14085 [Niveispirillum cyanobacteriorum]GGE73055.1 hypothetical protein GCM10011317_32870 [Niveispirillum cyanobacteriorum]
MALRLHTTLTASDGGFDAAMNAAEARIQRVHAAAKSLTPATAEAAQQVGAVGTAAAGAASHAETLINEANELVAGLGRAANEALGVGRALNEVGGEAQQASAHVAETASAMLQQAQAARQATEASNAMARAQGEAAAEAARRMQAQAQAARDASEAQRRLNEMLGVRPPANDVEQRAQDYAEWGRRIDAVRARYVPLEQQLIEHRRALEEIAEAERLGMLTSDEATAARTRATAALRQAEAAHRQQAEAADGNARSTRLAAHEVTNLSYQLQDVFVQLAGGQNPFLILAQQGPQAASAVGGVSRLLSLIPPQLLLVAGITAGLAVVLGSAYAAWSSYRESVLAVDRANRMAPVSIGLTRAALEQQAQAAADAADISVKAARDQQAAYIATGKIGAQVMSGLIAISRDFAVATGQDLTEATAQLAKSFADPIRGAEDLTRSMGLLDDASLANVRSLAAMGRGSEAQAIILEALTQRVKGSAQELTTLGRVVAAVGAGFSNAWDWAGKTLNDLLVEDRDPTPKLQEQLKRAQIRAASAKADLDAMAASGRTPENSQRAAAISADYKSFEELARKHQAELTRIEKLSEAERQAERSKQIGVATGEMARQLDDYYARQEDLTRKEEALRKGLAEGTGFADRAQVEQQLNRVENALKTLLPEQEKARRLAEAEAAAVTMTGAAREKYLAKVRAEIETSGQLLTTRERQERVDQAVATVTNQHATALGDLTRQQRLAMDAQDRLAAAAGQGEAAQRAAANANEIAAASARSVAEGALAVEAAERRKAATVASISNELIEGMQAETEANNRVAAAMRQGGEAAAAAAREEFRLGVQRRLGVDAVEELTLAMKAYDALMQSRTARSEAGEQGQRLSDLRDELSLLERRNKLLAEQARGGMAGVAAGAAVARLDIQAQIDDRVLQRQRELLALSKQVQGINVETETLKYRFALEEQARLEEQLRIQEQAYRAASTLGGIFLDLEAGNIEGVADGVSQFLGEFRQLTAITGSATEAFVQMGEQLLNSAEAGYALGNALGEVLGRSEAQNRNARIGSTVATSIGDMFGVPQGISSFVGNIIGGLFGPGKSDATAGVDVYTASGRAVNFDTKASKQDSGNMSARDELGQSIARFAELLRTTTGGRVADKVSVEVGSRDGNRWRVQDASGALVSSGVTSVGDIEGTLSQVLAAMTRSLTGVADDLKARLEAVDYSDLSRAENDLTFILNYQTAIATLNGDLEGGADAVQTARQNVVDMLNHVRDFGAQAQRLGYNANETNAALRASVERFAGIREAAAPMTDLETKVAALRASFAELAPVLEAVGYTAADASAAVASAQARQLGTLKTDFEAGLARENRDLTGRGYLNAIDDLIRQRDLRYRDADAVGSARSLVDGNFAAGLDNALSALDIAAIQDIQAQFAAGTPVYEAAARAAAKLNGAVGTVAETVEQAAARIAATAALSDSLADRLARATGASDSQAGALAIFDRAAAQERAATQARVSAGELSASVLTELETTLGQERLAIIRRFSDAAIAEERRRAEQLAGINQSISDRLFASTNDEATQAGALAAFDRAAGKERAEIARNAGLDLAAYDAASAAERLQMARAAGVNFAQLDQTLANERLAIIRRFGQQAADVTRSIEDREFARTVAGKPDAEILLLERKQNAEFAAAIAAGYTTEQLERLRKVLAGEMTDAVNALNDATRQAADQARAAAKAVNDNLADRLFAATNDNSTLEGALAAFDRQAARDRIETAQTAGADMLALERTLAAERQAIINRFAQQAIDAEQQRLTALSQAGGQLRGWIDGIRATVGTSDQNLATMRAQFTQQLGRAQAGDVDAVQGLREYAQRLIDAETTRTASGADRRAMVEAILAQVEALPAVKSWDAQQLDVLTAIRNETVNNRGAFAVAVASLPSAATGGQIAAALLPHFQTLDQSLDGLITPAEFRAAIGPLATDAVADRWFRELDSNGDGMISKQEVTAKATSDLSGGSQGTLKAISDLTYAGNRDRLNIGDAIVRQLGSLGTIMADGNTRLANLHSWQASVWAVESQLLDKTKYNTAETAKKLGGGYAYAAGTDYHPGGWARVGEEGEEFINLPRGAQVFSRAQTLELARQPRTVLMGVSGGGSDNRALTAAIERQARATERQNALLEKIAANSAAGADAAAETAKALKTPARVRVGSVAKLAGGRQ